MPYIVENLMDKNYGMRGTDLVKYKQKFILASYHLNDFFGDKHFSLHMECKGNAAQMSAGCCINEAGWEKKAKLKQSGESLMA